MYCGDVAYAKELASTKKKFKLNKSSSQCVSIFKQWGADLYIKSPDCSNLNWDGVKKKNSGCFHHWYLQFDLLPH